MYNNTIKFTESFIAYKGFNKDLCCTQGNVKTQYAVGQTFEKPEKDKIRLCSDDGFHYCRQLKQVFHHYRRNEGNRFCKIEVLGNYKEDDSKGSTTKFRILEELDDKFFREYDKDIIEENLGLPILRKIQEKYPMFHVGGSTGLFLHGLYLKRWGANINNRSDLDLISPYFILPEDFEGIKVNYEDAKMSGNDFDETFMLETPDGGYCKVDYRVDPYQRYELIEYKGFKYKVSLLETIVEAKLKYARQRNGQKHKQDCYELLGKKKHVAPVVVEEEKKDLFDNVVESTEENLPY